MGSLTRWAATVLVWLRWPLLLGAVIATVVSFRAAQRVQYDRSVEHMFAPRDPLIQPYSRLKRAFGGNEVVLAVYSDEQLFAPDRSGLDRLTALRGKLTKLEGVQDVLSIDLPIGDKIVDPHSEIARKTRRLFSHLTHDDQGKIASLVCMLHPERTGRESTIDAIRRVMEQLPQGVGPSDGIDLRAHLDGTSIRVVIRQANVRVIVEGKDASPESTPFGRYFVELDDYEEDFSDEMGSGIRQVDPRDVTIEVDLRQIRLRTNEYVVRSWRDRAEAVSVISARDIRLKWEDGQLEVVHGDRNWNKDFPDRRFPKKGAKVLMHVDDQKFDVELAPLPDTLPPGNVTGEPAMVAEGFRLLDEDGQRLSLWSTILLGVVVIYCFRSIWWVAIPIAVVQLALLLTKATLVWSGLQLSMVSSMLTAIVTVVSVATVVHVILYFREARRQGRPPLEALRDTAGWLAAPIFFACLTDAVGFGSLLAAHVRPVRDFGLMMAIGALYSMAAVLIVVPGMAMAAQFIMGRVTGKFRLPRWSLLHADPQTAWGEGPLEKLLHGAAAGTRRYRWLIVATTLALTVFSIAGAFRLKIETDFTKNFRSDNEIVRSYKFVEENLGGAGVLDVVAPAPSPEYLNWPYLARIGDLEHRLRTEVVVQDEQGQTRPGLTYVLSLYDGAASGPFDLATSRFPDLIVRKSIQMMRENIPTFVDALYAEDPDAPGGYLFRIMLRAKERQPAEQKHRIIEQVEHIVQEEMQRRDWQEFLASAPQPTGADSQQQRSPGEVTGFFILLTNLISSMLHDQWVAFGVAAIGIGLMMFLAMLLCDPAWSKGFSVGQFFPASMRSVLLAGVALVPNVLPILVVMGAMGWLGYKINLGAVMISAVSLGLSVDSSIHYMISFRRRHAQLGDREQALQQTQQGVGRAVIFSTLALIVGFTVLCISEFVPTIYFGALVSLSMLGGLAGNLIVLPLLLRAVTPRSGISPIRKTD